MNEPKRLLGMDADEPLQKLLGAAHDDVLDDDRVGRVRAQLVAAGAFSVGAAGAAGAAGAGAAGASGASLSSTLGAKLAAAALAASVVVGGVALSLSLRAPHVEPTMPAASAAPVTSAPSAPSPPVEQPAATPPAPADRAAASAEPRQPAPRARVADSGPSRAAPTPREGLLLLQARQALEHDPARALALIREHERDFPKSQLASERASLRAEAAARVAR